MIDFNNDSLENIAGDIWRKNLRDNNGNIRLDSIIVLSMVELAKKYGKHITEDVRSMVSKSDD